MTVHTMTVAEVRDVTARAMSEAQLLDHVRALTRGLGLLTYHTHRSDRSEPGFPDLVIVGPGGILYRELKTQRGRLRPAQADWIAALTKAGQNVAVWRPRDLLDGAVLRELRQLDGRPGGED